MATQDFGGNLYNNITSAGVSPVVVKTGPGFLHSVTVNAVGTTWAITLYDNTAASGTNIIAAFTPAAIGTMTFDVSFNTGLTVGWTGTAGNITISYKGI